MNNNPNKGLTFTIFVVNITGTSGINENNFIYNINLN